MATKNRAIYTAAQRQLAVGFDDIVGYNDRNQPMIRKNVYFKDGTLVLDLDKEENKIIEKLLDNHPLNIKNNGTTSTGFRKQNVDDMERAAALVNQEVYCCEPEDGVQSSDKDAIEYLVRIQKNMPKTAIKNTVEKARHIHERFNFAGVAKPKETNSIRVIKARVVEMLDALEQQKIWTPDDDNSEG